MFHHGKIQGGKRAAERDNGDDYPYRLFARPVPMSLDHVMGCGKMDLHKASYTWGLDGKHLLPEWGFSDGIDNAGKLDAILSGAEKPQDPYMAFLDREKLRETHIADYHNRTGHAYAYTDPTPLPDRAYCDNWIAENGLKLLHAAPKDRSWFLAVNFTGPHPPVDITRSMDRACRGRE